MIARRHVYHLAGYDPIDAEAQHRRFGRQLDIFRRTWNVSASLSPLEQPDGRHAARWTVNAQGPDWQVEAVHEVWRWDDIVRADFLRPLPVRLGKAAVAYADFIATGTMFRYVMANQRYAIFFLFPLLALVLFAAGGWLGAYVFVAVLGLSGPIAVLAGIGSGIAVFLILLRWPGARWRVQQLLDDWIFARDYFYGRRPDAEARLDEFAEALVARVRAGGVDEIVIVGHSLGAMFALDVVVRALARDPDLGRHGVPVCVLTIGATIPKFALHPSAHRIRETIARVVAEPSVAWVEYQSRADTISFYRFDPVALKRIAGDRLDGKPVIRRVQIHDMLTPESFARYRRNVLRLHYQSVMANERRAPYDYYLMVCGPVAFADWTMAPLGFLDFVTGEGTLAGGQQGRAAAGAGAA
jgi:pimeloyl-ACP methyl ester carboxylesterase